MVAVRCVLYILLLSSLSGLVCHGAILVSSSVINVGKLVLGCEQADPGTDPSVGGVSGVQATGGVTATPVKNQWLSFLAALKQQSSWVKVEEEDGGNVSTDESDADERGETEQDSAETRSSDQTMSAVVPHFLRAVRIGHAQDDDSRQLVADDWNVTAIMGQAVEGDPGNYTFDLHFLHQHRHRYVEMVFSPSTYRGNGTVGMCSFTFCNRHGNVCANFTRTTVITGSLFYTKPVRYGVGDLFSAAFIKLTRISCDQTTIFLSGAERKPMMIFFHSELLANQINRFASVGWQRLTERRTRRGTRMKRRQRRATGAHSSNCRRETWHVTARDLGWDGVMIYPTSLEIGYCQGSCENSSETAHLKLRHNYIFMNGHLANSVIREADCVSTVLLPQSAVVWVRDTWLEIIAQQTLKVSQCGCR